MTPLVSILMPAWNAARFVSDAVESVRAQTYMQWELCFVDDGSTDGTFAVAQQAAQGDWRVKAVRIEHGGYDKAFNTALAMAGGQFIARQDADDSQSPDRLQMQVAALEVDGELNLVTCAARVIDATGAFLRDPPCVPMDKKRYLSGAKRHGPPAATIVARRHVYDEVGGFSEIMETSQDADWDLRVLDGPYQWGHIPQPLYWYRRHPGQMTRRLGGHAVYLNLLRERGINV